MTPTMAIDRAPINRLRLTLARDAGLVAWEATGCVVEALSRLSHTLYGRTVPLPVGVYGVVAGKVGVKVAVTVKVLPFASVVIYVYGVGPPGVKGVVPGWPTGPCWSGAVVAAVAGVVVGLVAAAEEAEEAEAAVVAAGVVVDPPGANVSLEPGVRDGLVDG
jgi:hypothetical protein